MNLKCSDQLKSKQLSYKNLQHQDLYHQDDDIIIHEEGNFKNRCDVEISTKH